MLELLTFIVSLIAGIVITIALASNKSVMDALDCVKSIFETGRWSSR